MITYLNIENLGIIDKLEIAFTNKLNILTGETGAGKTLIVESLNLLAGARFSKDMIKKNADYLLVEASLNLSLKILKKANDNSELNLDLLDGNDILNDNDFIDIIITRRIDKDGKNICKINGRLVTVNELKKFVLYIIDIHGQHENQNIMLNETQVELVDRFAQKDIKNTYKEYFKKYESRQKLLSLLEKDLKDEMYTKRQIDLLAFQIKEIEEAELELGEDDELEKQYKIFNSSEKIIDVLNLSNSILSEDIIKNLSLIIAQLENISDLNEKYNEYLNSTKSAFYDLEEVNFDIKNELENINLDERALVRIENRLDKINSLKRKYGNTIESIKEYLENIKLEHESLVNFEKEKANLDKELNQLEIDMGVLADKLYIIRKKHAEEISKKVTKELEDLEMKSAAFQVKVMQTDKFNRYGKDILNFLIMTNKGSDFLLLDKIASGGEMSRVMLAIKTILSDQDETPILVFDEIDTGISGVTGQVAGEKLKHIAKKHQVLSVTHLATLASQGDSNYYIYKTEEDGITKTKINKLNEEEIIKEIARISSGKITKEALEYAKELRTRKKE